jgi:hypothetical protein
MSVLPGWVGGENARMKQWNDQQLLGAVAEFHARGNPRALHDLGFGVGGDVAVGLEIVKARLAEMDERYDAAKKLCEVYFTIAAEAIGEDGVRSRREALLPPERSA